MNEMKGYLFALECARSALQDLWKKEAARGNNRIAENILDRVGDIESLMAVIEAGE